MGGPRKSTAPAPADVVEETPVPVEEASSDADSTAPESGETPDTEAPPAETDAPAAPAPADVAEVTVVMNIAISGLRNGEPWPAPGGEIILPADEAETYVRLGYAREA